MNWSKFYHGRVPVIMAALRKANPKNKHLDHIHILLRETDDFFTDGMEDLLIHGGPDQEDNVGSALYCQIEAMRDYCDTAWNFAPGEQIKDINWDVNFDDESIRKLAEEVYLEG